MDRRFGLTIARGLVILGGLVLIGFGLFLAVTSDPSFPISGLFTIGFGILLIGATLIERMRYRSAWAEETSERHGPGGGEPLDRPMESRFRRTDERFVDPTTNTAMRVWIDPATGERRYRAEE